MAAAAPYHPAVNHSKLHIVLVQCSHDSTVAADAWYSSGLRILADSAASGHIFLYEMCLTAFDGQPLARLWRRRPTWDVSLTLLPNVGYEAGAYMHHLMTRWQLETDSRGAVHGFADSTFFLQDGLEKHVDLSYCPFSCIGCHRLALDEVSAQVRHRAQVTGYVGLSGSYRNAIVNRGDPCNQQIVRWTWRTLFPHPEQRVGMGDDARLPAKLAGTMNAVFAVSRTQLTEAFASRADVLHRAAWMVNSTTDDPREWRLRLYGGRCHAHPDWSPVDRPERGLLLRTRRKLEAIGLEMLWHVVLGASPVLPLPQAPCVKWYLDMDSR